MGARAAFRVQSHVPGRSFLIPNPPPDLGSSRQWLKSGDFQDLGGTTKVVPLRGSEGLGIHFGHFTPSTTNRSDKVRAYV
jgi:hypothetical protein